MDFFDPASTPMGPLRRVPVRCLSVASADTRRGYATKSEGGNPRVGELPPVIYI